MPDSRPIGFFDSGVGGLTVLREALRRLPGESTIYLGDNARAPYGPRSDAEVIAFSGECLDHLATQDVKAIVVACNTASSVGLAALRRRCAVPVLGVVRPGATAAALATRSHHVGVIATAATIRSHAYRSAIREESPVVQVREHATPMLVPLVESGRLEGPEVTAIVQAALAPLFEDDPGIDTLLLGCTHYPLLAGVIGSLVGRDIAVIDSATATASAIASLLEVDGIAAPAGASATHLQLTTGDLTSFVRTATLLFGSLFPAVEHIELAGGDREPGVALAAAT